MRSSESSSINTFATFRLTKETIEISMVNDLLYKVFHYSCVDIVLTDVLLNNAFSLGEDVGSIHVQWWYVFCLYCLLHRPGTGWQESPQAAALECLAAAAQCQLR
jgi:hypothetical protein